MALLDRLGRIVTPGRRLIPQIDGFRFVAIASVYFYHVAHSLTVIGATAEQPTAALSFLMNVGRYGVELFFVISGFVLALPFVRARLAGGKPVSLRAYYLRRLTRLEPPYIVLMLAHFVLLVATHRFSGPELWPHLLAGLIYQHNQIYGGMNPVQGATWSLEVEVQFYMLTPLLACVFLLRNHWLRRLSLVALSVAMGVSRYLIMDWRYFASVLGQLHEFFAGYLLADIYVVGWNEAPGPSRAWDVIAMLGWIAIWPLVAYEQYFYAILPMVVLATYWGSMRGPLCRRVFGNSWIVVIGGMCYTIYLVHSAIILYAGWAGMRVAPMLGFTGAFVLWSILLTPVVLLLSALFFAYLERPCMNPRWPHLLLKRVRGPERLKTDPS
ncbi:MAG TPA: acyltransferase [Polyangia bacterium]